MDFYIGHLLVPERVISGLGAPALFPVFLMRPGESLAGSVTEKK